MARKLSWHEKYKKDRILQTIAIDETMDIWTYILQIAILCACALILTYISDRVFDLLTKYIKTKRKVEVHR